MSEQRSVVIAPGVSMPMIGLGTWSLTDPYVAVRTALDLGYRHIDTAFQYQNEAVIGRALRDSGIPREDIFVTSKITSSRIGLEDETISSSLRDLKSDHVDLWLIHDPPPPGASERLWEYMIGLRERGLARAIGVSEYGTGQLDAVADATGVTPAVNQIRWAPALYDGDRLRHLADRGVAVVGFSVLRLTDLCLPSLVEIADAHGVTVPQVLVRWHIDHGAVAIPRSSTPARIGENLDVWGFELTDSELAAIDALSVVNRTPSIPALAFGTAPLGSVGVIVAPTGVPTGAGEIEIPDHPAHLAWSAQPVAVGSLARVVDHRGIRAVEVEAVDIDSGS